MEQEALLKLIKEYAHEYTIDKAIVYGVAKQESNLDVLAIRHEPDYRWVYKPKEVKPRWCSVNTERMLQKTSIGLMQVMGAVFREYGYEGWLTAIIADPRLQLHYGCMHLKKKLKKYGEEGGVAAYNAGSPRRNAKGKFVNQYYVDNVLKYADVAVATGLL